MTNKMLPMIALASGLVLTACNPTGNGSSDAGNGDSAAVAEGEVIATVNGQPITEETLAMISEANRRANIPREKLIDDLIKHELLYQEAVRKNLESNKDVAQRLDFIKRSILSQAAMQDFILNAPVTEEEIQKEYDQNFSGDGSEEYKARHILTETEDKAKEVIQKLKGGGDFDSLAKEYSTGPTGPKGGDLGWFNAQQMVAPFSEAVIALKNGDYTQEPVQTQFGWHVILREDSRAKTPPPLNAMKANIQAQLQRKAIEKHLEDLKANAKIEIIPPKPAEPVTTEPAAVAPAPQPAADQAKPAAQEAEPAKPAAEATTVDAGAQSAEPKPDEPKEAETKEEAVSTPSE